MARRGIVAALALLLVAAVPTSGTAVPPLPELLKPGEPAPRFRIEDLQSRQLKGFDEIAPDQPLLLIFLQTACRSCVREMLAVKQLQQEVGGFGVLGVFLDMSWGDLEPFIQQYELSFVFAWDPSEIIAKEYGVTVSPVTFLIDRERKIAAVYPGYVTGLERYMRQDLERLARR